MKNILSHCETFKPELQKNQEYSIQSFTRFGLQNYLQELLLLKKIVRKNQNFYKCHRWSWSAICSLMRNNQTSRAYYNSLVTCHNSKCCPVCAPRIMGVRSAEIRTAVHKWLNEDPENTCYMLTLTFRHKITDSLDYILSLFKKSLQTFWRNGSVKRMFNTLGRVGRITATEITYSRKNGFHPHQHILLFCKRSSFDVELLRRSWCAALQSSGMYGDFEHGLDFEEAKTISDYLTKISSEMALGHLKQGRGNVERYSPFQLALAGLSGEVWASDAFVEYYKAVRGQHFLCWSRGLKKYFGINDVSDEEISQGAAQSELVRFMDILGDDFRKCTWQHKAALQNYAASNDYPAAAALLDRLNVKHWKEYAEA